MQSCFCGVTRTFCPFQYGDGLHLVSTVIVCRYMCLCNAYAISLTVSATLRR